MKKVVFLLGIFLCLKSVAQQNPDFTFKGRLIRKSDTTAVSYASISIRNKDLGVVANEQGEFELVIPSEYWDDSITIDAIGFKSYLNKVSNLRSKQYHEIILQDTAYQLSQVVVSNLTAKDILLRAFDNTAKNFSDIPYQMDGFYRCTIKESGIYVKMVECLYKAFDKGSNYADIPEAVDVIYTSVRRSSDFSSPNVPHLPYPFFRPRRILTTHNYTRKKNFQLSENIKNSVYDIEFETPQFLDNKLIYVISAKVKDDANTSLYDMKLYIRENDYAIIRFDADFGNRLYNTRVDGLPES